VDLIVNNPAAKKRMEDISMPYNVCELHQSLELLLDHLQLILEVKNID
jgi:hypothetical protein